MIQMGEIGSINKKPRKINHARDEKYEGGSDNGQVTVEAGRNLNLQQMGSIDSNSFSDSSSEQGSNREAEEAGTPKKNRKGKSKSFCEMSIFTNSIYVIFQATLGISYFLLCVLEIFLH